LSGCVDTAGKGGSQTKPGRCQLNLVDGDHRRRRGRSLIFRCAGHDQGGALANENKHAAGAILNRQTFYLDAEDTYQAF